MGPGTVIAILGPTGVGKTDIAIELARRLKVRIISCDSMQLYRGFTVLTNQPSPEQMAEGPHELVAVREPEAACSAGEYAAAARPLIENDLAARGWALVVGGTGLYLRAALGPLAMAPAADPAVRRRWEDVAATGGTEALHAELHRRDPAAAEAIGPHNLRRLIRALEVMETTRSPWSGRQDLWQPTYDYPTLLVGLTLDRQELYHRIDQRAAAIVAGGAEEVRRHLVKAAGPGSPSRAPGVAGPGDPAATATAGFGPPPAGIECAIGFREIARYVRGEQGFDETVAQVATATRHYARRQLTWLRKLSDAVIIDVQDRAPAEVADRILALALSGEHTKEPPKV